MLFRSVEPVSLENVLKLSLGVEWHSGNRTFFLHWTTYNTHSILLDAVTPCDSCNCLLGMVFKNIACWWFFFFCANFRFPSIVYTEFAMARNHFLCIGIPFYNLETKIKGMAWLEGCLKTLWGHLDKNTIQKWLAVVTLI